ncbi:MAG: 16S rRNA (adenine(1518)-N(6)/adenine(1519)-N(6))-dimethyltransferase RsmA [Candidatus Dormibacteraeota bacterium]|nr:16S rRNA (adenine(1518)-N(6)/adenine(1519)-N(6))-dimethyltransferase RsmA [Candidatus Dormibacteraeota bacterium]
MNPVDPAVASQLAGLLRRHRIQPAHRLGQNFLVDAQIRDRVAAAAGIQPGDTVLEVGAGPGALSVALAPLASRLVCVEIDRRLLGVLREVVAGHDNVELQEGDVLKMALPAAEVVAGNIPYYLTGALLPRLMDSAHRPRQVSLVVQKEVALRWTQPGDWSLGSLAVHVHSVPEYRFTIPREAFTPVPGVDSALVTLAIRAQPAVKVDDLHDFFRFAERIFQFRRKQLGGTMTRLEGAGAAGVLAGSGLDPARRPQTLSLEEWQVLYGAFRSTVE